MTGTAVRGIRLLVSLALVAPSLAGCAAGMGNEQMGQGTGSIVGAIAGGIIGHQFGSGQNQAAATAAGVIVGAIVGGMIGRQIGKTLDEEERAALHRKMAAALNKGKEGEAFAWTSPKSKASAKYTAQKARNEQRVATIMRPVNLEPTPPLDVIGEPYVFKTDATLYAGPRTGGAPVGKLKKGEQVVAMGKVKGQPWMVVGRDNNVLGYAPASQMVAASDSGSIDRVLVAEAPQQPTTTASATGLVPEQVAMNTTCREMSYSVAGNDGQAEEGKVDACKTTNGNWSYPQG